MSKTIRTILLLLIVVVAGVSLVVAHPGGLDSKGGHTDGKTGEYHTHGKKKAAEDAPQAEVQPEVQSEILERLERIEQQLKKVESVCAG